MVLSSCRVGCCLALLFGASVVWGQSATVPVPDVAGLTPYERPSRAPRMPDVVPDPDWRRKALHGVSDPIPSSLDFLQNHGRWYSPFFEPGMTGRYDIRGFHAARRQ